MTLLNACIIGTLGMISVSHINEGEMKNYDTDVHLLVYKYPSKDRKQDEKYMIKDKDELKNANDIWKKIISK